MKFKKWICAILALMLLMGTALAAGSELGEYASRVVSETNADRLKNGLDALRVDPALTAAARIRAQEITQKFSHTRPDGTRWATVSSAAYGENIARGQKTPDKVVAAWMSSDGHRRNILRGRFGSIGVCCLKYNGVYYWVQLFGK